MEKPIVCVVFSISYNDTTPSVCLFDGEVRVPAKGVKKGLILRDLENLTKSDNRLFVLGILGIGIKPRPLERTCSEVGSRGMAA